MLSQYYTNLSELLGYDFPLEGVFFGELEFQSGIKYAGRIGFTPDKKFLVLQMANHLAKLIRLYIEDSEKPTEVIRPEVPEKVFFFPVESFSCGTILSELEAYTSSERLLNEMFILEYASRHGMKATKELALTDMSGLRTDKKFEGGGFKN